MNVSRLKLSPNLTKQQHTYTRILLALQANRQYMNSTNMKQISIVLDVDNMKQSTVYDNLKKMYTLEILQRVGSHRRANYTINYLHPMVSKEVLKAAPKSIQEQVNKQLKSLSSNQTIDSKGCIITPAVGTEEEVYSDEPHTDMSTVTQTVPVTADFDGKSINITINLNIKLNS